MNTREEIIETVNKLFIYTDSQNWDALQSEVFTEKVFLDMTSLGGNASDLKSIEICDMWQEGFKELDAINHLAGNYLVELVSDNEAEVFAYATATHFKDSAANGKTREFVGTYNFKLKKLENGWRLYSFVYNLKYANGNLELK